VLLTSVSSHSGFGPVLGALLLLEVCSCTFAPASFVLTDIKSSCSGGSSCHLCTHTTFVLLRTYAYAQLPTGCALDSSVPLLLVCPCFWSAPALAMPLPHTAMTQYRRFERNIHRKRISQFPHSCVSERFIYSHRSGYSATGKYVDRSWEYINRLQTHECGNWERVRAIPFLGIYKCDFRCSAGMVLAMGVLLVWCTHTPGLLLPG
jgi:hypothetical protein